MGFLNKWFGKLSGQVEKLYSKNTAQQNSHSTSAASVSCSTCGMEELQKQFSVLYRQNFPQYTILENVPARQLQADCHPACTPVQFLFCRGNRRSWRSCWCAAIPIAAEMLWGRKKSASGRGSVICVFLWKCRIHLTM